MDYTDPTQRHEPASARGPIVAAIAFVIAQWVVVFLVLHFTVGGGQ